MRNVDLQMPLIKLITISTKQLLLQEKWKVILMITMFLLTSESRSVTLITTSKVEWICCMCDALNFVLLQ